MFYYYEGELEKDSYEHVYLTSKENNNINPSKDIFSKDCYSSIQKTVYQNCRKTQTRRCYNMILSYYNKKNSYSKKLSKILRRKYNK